MPKKPDLRHITATELHPLAVPLDAITRDPDNERAHPRENLDRIKYALRRLGVRGALSLRADGQLVTKGNGTHQALEELAEERATGLWAGAPEGPLAWGHVPVLEFDDDAETAAEYRVLDNRAGDNAGWSRDAIKASFEAFPDVDWEKSWTPAELAAEFEGWGEEPTPEPEQNEEPPIPEPPAKPVTKPGDIWILGDHRLICGSCREPEVVARLLDGVEVNVAFTSPPYASQRKYDETSGFKPIKPDDYVEWFEAVQANVREHLADDGSWFVNIKEHSEGLSLSLYVKELVIAHARQWGWLAASEYAWERNGMPGYPKRRFKNQFEPVFHFARAEWKFRPKNVQHATDDVVTYSRDNQWSSGLAPVAGGSGKGWANAPTAGLAYPGNRLPVFGAGNETSHSASFPVGLPTFFIKAYSDEDDVIFDPFMGSGTVIIAAEREGRRGYGCEISPGYCDVIVRRWEAETGRKATRHAA